ncbi:methyl-accepting chemotaxis protein [Peredibacter sp. HCB2-198]|uniref:HAMP domain-containing methyl-accepting chemotaxis protein n=1 Tax=Peredibacter sp. HCB2-198 TaxID=3383025 RepID=UPI0038B51395
MQSKSLRTRLLAAFLGVSSFLVITATVAHFSSKKVFNDFHFVSTEIMQTVILVGKINEAMLTGNRNLFRAYLAADLKAMKESKDAYIHERDALNEYVKQYLQVEFMPGEKEILQKFIDNFKIYDEKSLAYLNKLENGWDVQLVKDEAYVTLYIDLPNYRKSMTATLKELIQFNENLATTKTKEAISVYKSSSIITMVISALGVLFATCLGLFISSRISKTLNGISQEISTSSDQTSQTSQELSSSSAQLSQGATESAASLEETVSSLEELSSMVKLNSDHAKEASSLSQCSLASAEQGDKELTRLITSMESMGKSSKKIEEIINVIDDIAFQTNLLALNAAVEAARAGDQGRGFAVVADAVRNLAGRSAAAAKDINVLIKENVEKTNESSKMANSSGVALKEIVTSAKKVADLNSEISAASQEQANGIEQISKAMHHLDSAIQSNASSSEEVASSAEEMSSQAKCLSQLVSDLQVFVDGGKAQVKKVSRPVQNHEDKKLKLVSHYISSKKPAKSVLPFETEENIPIKKAEGF